MSGEPKDRNPAEKAPRGDCPRCREGHLSHTTRQGWEFDSEYGWRLIRTTSVSCDRCPYGDSQEEVLS